MPARVLWSCVFLPFARFIALHLVLVLEYGSISHFKGVLKGFCGADVYLYGLRSLRGLCGFCARVELGG